MAPTGVVDKNEALAVELNKINKNVLIDILVRKSMPDTIVSECVKKYFEDLFSSGDKDDFHESSDETSYTREAKLVAEIDMLNREKDLLYRLNSEMELRNKDQSIIIKLLNDGCKCNVLKIHRYGESPSEKDRIDNATVTVNTDKEKKVSLVKEPNRGNNIDNGVNNKVRNYSDAAKSKKNRKSSTDVPSSSVPVGSSSSYASTSGVKYEPVVPAVNKQITTEALPVRSAVNTGTKNKLLTGKNSDRASKIQGAPMITNIYVGRVNGDISEDTMGEFVKNAWPDIDIRCLKLNSKGSNSSFKLSFENTHRNTILDDSKWPNGVLIKIW